LSLSQQRGRIFADVTKEAGRCRRRLVHSAGWFDYDRDGDSIFLSRIISIGILKRVRSFVATAEARVLTVIPIISKARLIFYFTNARRTFADVSAKTRIADPNGKALGVALRF